MSHCNKRLRTGALELCRIMIFFGDNNIAPKCLRTSVSHQLPSSFISGVIFSLVSDSIAPIYQSMRLLFRWVSSRFCDRAIKCFCILFRRLCGHLPPGRCCRFNWKNLQMFGVNSRFVSALGTVLVHNLEGRGILSSVHNHQQRKWNCQNWDPPEPFSTERDPRGGLIGRSEGPTAIEV